MSDLQSVRVLFYYRSYANVPGISHAGLGISATNNYKVLRQNGIDALLKPLVDEVDMGKQLEDDPGITHVVTSAPWITTDTLRKTANLYPEVTFACNVHSNIGFLQTDPTSIKRIREEIDLEQWTHNFHIAGNSERYCEAMTDMYRVPCTFLPNMYYLDDTNNTGHVNIWTGGTLRVLIGGAPRAQKNVTTGAAGAVIAARELGAPLELWLNSGRNDGGEATRILNAVRAMTDGLPNVTVKYLPWSSWPDFRRFAATVHIGVQMSTTETYNIVTADLASQGVPSIVAPSITWAPTEWYADVDHASDVGRRMIQVLLDPRSGRRGLQALADRNALCLTAWKRYLVENRFGTGARAWSAIGHPMSSVHNLSKPLGGRHGRAAQ